ncbi:hypothetical protein C725_1409 [Pacificimonas flava]|uniref:Uncharacterized protein n=1 Tax=Pacificimonas flava TaxID=1234595 RepID=M2U674_9SPHN|nr:hypothetical protein C725_1409 [Pacificimonas flava]
MAGVAPAGQGERACIFHWADGRVAAKAPGCRAGRAPEFISLFVRRACMERGGLSATRFCWRTDPSRRPPL